MILFFDPYRRSADCQLSERIMALVEDMTLAEHELGLRERARSSADAIKFGAAIEALACNLLILDMTEPTARLAVPRAAKAMWSGPEGADVYGSHFLAALDVMAHPEVGLIREETRGYRLPNGQSASSTISATPALLKQLEASSVTWNWFTRVSGPALDLKAPRKGGARPKSLPFAETGKTRKLRRQVEALNAHLRSMPLHLVRGSERSYGFDTDGQPIDPTRREVRRVFNNGSWTQGGRLFGGFWEGMPRVKRFELLRIGTRQHPAGEGIANVDFEQLFPRLAYVCAGHRALPEGDLYDIAGDGQHRAGWKKLVNAMLFADGSLKNWPEETRTHFPKGTKLRDCVEAIERKHGAIARYFGRGLGYRLMFMESEMLLYALEGMGQMGVPALPLHDSVLVGRSDAEEAKEILAEAFKLHADQPRAFIKIDIGE